MALGLPETYYADMRVQYAKRRSILLDSLDAAGLPYRQPEGAYYVLPRILLPHEDSFAFSLSLLEQARVAVTPGSAFGPTGENHVRMAYCVSEDTINEAFDRIAELHG